MLIAGEDFAAAPTFIVRRFVFQSQRAPIRFASAARFAETRPPWGQSGSQSGQLICASELAREPHPLRLATSSAVDVDIIIISTRLRQALRGLTGSG